MREGLRRRLPLVSALLLLAWAVSVTGATGWSASVNWALLLTAGALLGVRAVT
jgi:hypothetical protein